MLFCGFLATTFGLGKKFSYSVNLCAYCTCGCSHGACGMRVGTYILKMFSFTKISCVCLCCLCECVGEREEKAFE